MIQAERALTLLYLLSETLIRILPGLCAQAAGHKHRHLSQLCRLNLLDLERACERYTGDTVLSTPGCWFIALQGLWYASTCSHLTKHLKDGVTLLWVNPDQCLLIDMTMIDWMVNGGHAINLDICTHTSSSPPAGSRNIGRLVHYFCPDWNIPANIGGNGMKFCTEINGPQ